MIRSLRGTVGTSLCFLSHRTSLAQYLALKREVAKQSLPAPRRRLGARRDVVTSRTHVLPPRLFWRHRGLQRRLHISQSSRHSWVTRHVLSRLFRMPSPPAQHWTLGSTVDRICRGAPPPLLWGSLRGAPAHRLLIPAAGALRGKAQWWPLHVLSLTSIVHFLLKNSLTSIQSSTPSTLLDWTLRNWPWTNLWIQTSLASLRTLSQDFSSGRSTSVAELYSWISAMALRALSFLSIGEDASSKPFTPLDILESK